MRFRTAEAWKLGNRAKLTLLVVLFNRPSKGRSVKTMVITTNCYHHWNTIRKTSLHIATSQKKRKRQKAFRTLKRQSFYTVRQIEDAEN